MKLVLTIVGAVLILIGLTWLLQGLGVLPGSFMTGQPRWAMWGALAAISGVAVIVLARRRRRG